MEQTLLGLMIKSFSKFLVFFLRGCQFNFSLLKFAPSFFEKFDSCFVDFPNANGNPLIEKLSFVTFKPVGQKMSHTSNQFHKSPETEYNEQSCKFFLSTTESNFKRESRHDNYSIKGMECCMWCWSKRIHVLKTNCP